jgi:hypothetical protein
MSVLRELLRAFGLLGFERRSIDGVQCHWRRDLQPVGADDVPAGELVELVATLTDANVLLAAPKVRFDILEEDAFLTGGWDDPVVSLVGTGATAPAGFPVSARATEYVEVQSGETFEGVVEQFKRAHAADYDTRMLAVSDISLQASWVVTWWRAQRLEDFLGAEMYFLLTLEDGRTATNDAIMNVDDGPPGTAVRLSGRVVDANPFDAGTPEPVPGTELALAGRVAGSGADGSFVLDARLTVGHQVLEVHRPGIDPLSLAVDVAAAAGGALAVTVKDAAGATLATATTPAAPDPAKALACPLGDVGVVVHKLRGTITWPDSLDGTAAYTGTPERNRYVFALPLAAGATQTQRPRTTAAWAQLRNRPGVRRSYRPGRPAQREATGADGAWEIRLLDLSVGRSHLLWVEGPDPDAAGETSPEYLVRTFHADLERIDAPVTTLTAAVPAAGGNSITVADPAGFTAGRSITVGERGQEAVRILAAAGPTLTLVQPNPPAPALAHGHAIDEVVAWAEGDADTRAVEGRHLIDHTFNLRASTDEDCVGWGLDVLRVVDWEADPAHPDPNTADLRVIRPARGVSPGDFDRSRIGGAVDADRLSFDAARRLVSGIDLRALPLMPTFGPAADRSAAARRAGDRLAAAADTVFPRGHRAAACRYVLDARRLDDAVDLTVGANWDATPAADDVELRARRRCELLERTWIVTPSLPGRITAAVSPVTDAHWTVDAVSLADGAFAAVPDQHAPGNDADDAVAPKRALTSDWVAVLEPVTPRLLGLAHGRTLLLAPGHGFFASPPLAGDTAADRAQWKSTRGGWQWSAGEDDNDLFMAREIDRIVVANGMLVENVRSVRDLLRIGVVQTAPNTFRAGAPADFLRLWQQDPVYYLGSVRDPGVPPAQRAVTDPAAPAAVADNREDAGVNARQRLGTILANRGTLDVIFSVHTNAGGARGGEVLFLDLRATGAEENTLGRGLATHVAVELRDRCHTVSAALPAVARSLSDNQGGGISDLQNTFDHWTDPTGPLAHPPPAPQNSTQRPRRLTAGGPSPPWQHRSFPGRARVALAEVAFHANAKDAALLSRAWFRRTAGEAMAFGIEQGLRDPWSPAALGAEPRPFSPDDLAALLAAAFGPTGPVRALPAGAGAIAAGAITAGVTAVTGEAIAAGVTLDAAVSAIENARNLYSRERLLDALTGAFAGLAGYPANHADIDAFVTRRIEPLGAAVRAAKPPTRAEAGAWVAAGAGLRPATLAKAIDVHPNGVVLMEDLAGAAAPDRFVPRLEGEALVARIRRLRAQDVYRAVALLVADRFQDPLAPDSAGGYSVAWDQEITILADTAGVGWNLALEDISFAIGDGKGFAQTLGATLRGPERLGSAVWRARLPRRAAEPYTLSVSAKPPGSPDALVLGSASVRIGHG